MLLSIFILLTACSTKTRGNHKKDKEIQFPKTFKLIKREEMKNIQGTRYIFEHIKTGGHVLYIDDGSKEKVFGIGFKTPVVDNSGVNHVFEHAVLQGSKKYPDKNLFYKLETRNIPSFLNAMTGQDYTVYPFSAVEPKSFYNLMDVYLDAVFNPSVLEDLNTLKREGWRYDINPNNGKLIYNGIVYNEMKGAFSNPFRSLFFKFNKLVYNDPMANYGFSSGGLPSEIPTLTLDKLRKTHKKYYTPSNAILVLGGELDLNAALTKVDEYYKEYEKEPKAKLALQETPLKDEFHELTYPGPANSPNMYVYATLLKPKTNLFKLGFITSLLADYEISPLRKLFVEKKFKGNLGFGNDFTIQPRSYFYLQGGDKKELKDFRETMDKAIEEISKTGISKEVIDLALRDYKKEAAKALYSKNRATDMIVDAAHGEFYFDQPDLFLSNKEIETLENLAKNPELIKEFIKENFVENKNKTEIYFTPDSDGFDKIDKVEKEKLQSFEDNLSQKEKKDLKKEIEKFNQWSKAPVPKEIEDTIPSITLDDLKDSEIETVEREIIKDKEVTFINNKINTYGINLVSLQFDTSNITKDEKLFLNIFYNVITASGTKDYSYEEIDTNLTKYFFKLNISNSAFPINKEESKRLFTIYFEYLQDDEKEVYSTLKNILLESKFDNKAELKRRLEGFKDSIVNSGSDANVINRIAILKALAMQNPTYNYQLDGEVSTNRFISNPLYLKLSEILDNYDEEYPKLIQEFKKIRKKVFNKTNLVVVYANKGNFETFHKNIEPLLKSIPTNPITPVNYAKKETERLAIEVPAQNGATAWVGDLDNMGYTYSGKYKVMGNMINDYLNDTIRVQNGAYGAWFYITNNHEMVAASYRDGEVDKTLGAYKGIPLFLENEEKISDEKFDGYKLKAMSKYYQAHTPDTLFHLSYSRYLHKITEDSLEREKKEILDTKKDDIKEFVAITKKFLGTKFYTTVNSKNIIKEKSKKGDFDKELKLEDLK